MTPEQEKEFLILAKLVVACAGAMEIICREYNGPMSGSMFNYSEMITKSLNELIALGVVKNK